MFKSFAYLGLVVVGQVAATAIDSSSHQIAAIQTIGNAPDTLAEVVVGLAAEREILADTKSENLLVQAAKSTTFTTKSKNEKGFGIGEFILGLFMLPFALVLLWKNEKKLVTYAKVITQARSSVREVDFAGVTEEENLALVHGEGETEQKETLADQKFKVEVENSYRLVRTVEMFQWQETRHEEKQGDQTRIWYSHSKSWSSSKIDSASFHEQAGHENPSASWPFVSETITAQNVTIGKFRLNHAQISRLGTEARVFNFKDDGAAAIEETLSPLEQNNFAAFAVKGAYLVSSATEHTNESEHVGQYRVKFHFNEVGKTTVMSQAIKDDEGQFTFRKWNPSKLQVAYGISTDADSDGPCASLACCYLCKCVNCCLNAMFEEVIDVCRDGKLAAEEYFKSQDEALDTAAKVIRPLGIFLTMFGIYCLFAPIIQTLAWIPLIGGLLSTVAAVAAFIVAFIIGGTLSTLTIAIAWVFFRPLVGIALLTLTSVGVYLIFFLDWEKVLA